MKVKPNEEEVEKIELNNIFKKQTIKFDDKVSFDRIKDLLKNDIRTEIYELIIKIFHTPNYIIKDAPF